MPHEIKSLLTLLNRPADLSPILGWANRLAKDFDATADGAFLRFEMARDPYLFLNGVGYYPSDMSRQIQEASDEAERVARDEFECASKRGARCRMGAFHALNGVSGLARFSRQYDFALTHLPESSSLIADETILAELLLKGGVPVFAAPRTTGSDAPLQSALVAWDASLEASRALRASLALLKECRRVHVRTVAEKSVPATDLAGVTAYLQRHGVEVSGEPVQATETVGKTILVESERLAADLIVMGAFGHKPWREQLFGGATHEVLRSSRKPVVLAS